MMMEMDGNFHVIDQLAEYALGSLSPEEMRQVEGHLRHCADCLAELAAYQAVVGRLPLVVPQVAPPPSLKQAILRQVGAETPARRPKARMEKAGLLGRLGFLVHPVPAWGLVATVLLLIALLAGNLFLLQRNQALQQAALPNNGFRVVAMQSTDFAPQASGWIVVSADGKAGTLIVQGLPRLPNQQQYQLWLIKDGQRKSGGVFSVDHDGYASLWVYSLQPLVDYQQFGITVEPSGGSPGPTGAKVLGGKF